MHANARLSSRCLRRLQIQEDAVRDSARAIKERNVAATNNGESYLSFLSKEGYFFLTAALTLLFSAAVPD
jgi:hypothetical protein